MSALSPKARQLYDTLRAQGRTWAGREDELAYQARLHYPIDRAIIVELLDAQLIKFNCVGPSWWLFIFDEKTEAA